MDPFQIDTARKCPTFFPSGPLSSDANTLHLLEQCEAGAESVSGGGGKVCWLFASLAVATLWELRMISFISQAKICYRKWLSSFNWKITIFHSYFTGDVHFKVIWTLRKTGDFPVRWNFHFGYMETTTYHDSLHWKKAAREQLHDLDHSTDVFGKYLDALMSE